jgi:hypothetical protein
MPFVIFEKYSTYLPSIVARIRCSNISAVTEHWGKTNLTFFRKWGMRIKRDVEGCGVSRWLRVRWGSCGGIHQGEVTSKTSLTNMSKSEKSAYFRHIFAIGFFGCILTGLFGGFGIGVRFCVFWYPYWIFNEKGSFLLLALLVHFDCGCAGGGSRKRRVSFCECVLEF